MRGLEFLRENGASRVKNYDAQPFLLDDGLMEAEDVTEEDGLAFEIPPDQWRKIDVSRVLVPKDWSERPQRFVDGKHVGRVVAWLRSREGYPVPVQLSEIGAVEMCDINGTLRRTGETVERVVALMAHLFPWDEVESFAAALQQNNYRLLIAEKPRPLKEGAQAGYSYDFERMRKTTHNRSNDEMLRLEKQMLARACSAPTVVDGRLEPRASAFSKADVPVVGLIKTHSKNYLHPVGWQAYYELQPRQRTPAFRLTSTQPEVITWYLRLDGAQNDMPNFGIVRVEVPARFFSESCSTSDKAYIDRLSQTLCDYRCRDEGYGRAAISIYPIQRAEESLGSLFTATETLVSRFYRLTDL